jgi:hypothetical protein
MRALARKLGREAREEDQGSLAGVLQTLNHLETDLELFSWARMLAGMSEVDRTYEKAHHLGVRRLVKPFSEGRELSFDGLDVTSKARKPFTNSLAV